MRWLLTALRQIFSAVFTIRRDTIEIGNKLFDEIEKTGPGMWKIKRVKPNKRKRSKPR